MRKSIILQLEWFDIVYWSNRSRIYILVLDIELTSKFQNKYWQNRITITTVVTFSDLTNFTHGSVVEFGKCALFNKKKKKMQNEVWFENHDKDLPNILRCILHALYFRIFC